MIVSKINGANYRENQPRLKKANNQQTRTIQQNQDINFKANGKGILTPIKEGAKLGIKASLMATLSSLITLILILYENTSFTTFGQPFPNTDDSNSEK